MEEQYGIVGDSGETSGSDIIFSNIEGSDWECELFGTGRSFILNPSKGDEPNWFWRKMQYLIFGNKWIRKSPPKEE